MNVLIFGATGMVGIEVLHQALNNPSIKKVISIGRSKIDISSTKLTQVVHGDYLNYESIRPYFSEADICFYCLGVYQTKVSKDDFWLITVDYLHALLKDISTDNQDVRFCLFSAQGASPDEKSLFLFGNAKGRAERKLTESGIKDIFIFRPGFINPGRRVAFGGIMLRLYRLMYKIFPSIGIDSYSLAKAMLRVALNGGEKTVYENKDIRYLSN